MDREGANREGRAAEESVKLVKWSFYLSLPSVSQRRS
jgi:hypothetical protein